MKFRKSWINNCVEATVTNQFWINLLAHELQAVFYSFLPDPYYQHHLLVVEGINLLLKESIRSRCGTEFRCRLALKSHAFLIRCGSTRLVWYVYVLTLCVKMDLPWQTAHVSYIWVNGGATGVHTHTSHPPAYGPESLGILVCVNCFPDNIEQWDFPW